MKFFKRKPKVCSICGAENPIKHAKPFWHFCQKCWNETYSKVTPRVMQQIEQAKQSGKMLDVKDAKSLTKEITKEIQNETI